MPIGIGLMICFASLGLMDVSALYDRPNGTKRKGRQQLRDRRFYLLSRTALMLRFSLLLIMAL